MKLNIKQQIVFWVMIGFALTSLLTWAGTGFQIWTKTKVPVEVVDELFGTISIEWQNKFVLGLDIAGSTILIAAGIGLILIYFLRTKLKS